MKIFCLVVGIVCGFYNLALAKLQGGSQGSKQATFERFDGTCPGHSNVPIIYELQAVRIEGNTMWLNTTFTVKEDILTEPTMSVSLERCKSKENPDTCEHFHNYKTSKYCAVIKTGSGLWGSFFERFTPEWRCPFKKGTYRGIDSMIDMSAMLLLTGSDWFWRSQVAIREKRTNRMLCCMFIDAVIADGPHN